MFLYNLVLEVMSHFNDASNKLSPRGQLFDMYVSDHISYLFRGIE